MTRARLVKPAIAARAGRGVRLSGCNKKGGVVSMGAMINPAAPAAIEQDGVHQRAIVAKVGWRIALVLIPTYVAMSADRNNVGFAALTMNRDLGLTAQDFGFGAGCFFLSFLVLGVPFNLWLQKLGARRWISGMTLCWGLISGLTAVVWDAPSFFVARLLLGAAEAGFVPAFLLYLTYWIPAGYRARMTTIMPVAVAVSAMIQSPVSGWILDHVGNTDGLRSWQWLFILEALPSMAIAFVSYCCLDDGPHEARWLERNERDWLAEKLASERRAVERVRKYSALELLHNWPMMALVLAAIGQTFCINGLSAFLPQIVKLFGLTNQQVGLLLILPGFCTVIAVILWTYHSDATRERRWHAILPSLLGALSLVAAASLASPSLIFVALTLGVVSTWCAATVLFVIPATFLTGSAAAVGLASITAIGNIGGFAGPTVIGWLKTVSGDFNAGLYACAASFLLSALLTFLGTIGSARR